jgi:hypothetical protein
MVLSVSSEREGCPPLVRFFSATLKQTSEGAQAHIHKGFQQNADRQPEGRLDREYWVVREGQSAALPKRRRSPGP